LQFIYPGGVPLYPVLKILPSFTITAPTFFDTHLLALAISVANISNINIFV